MMGSLCYFIVIFVQNSPQLKKNIQLIIFLYELGVSTVKLLILSSGAVCTCELCIYLYFSQEIGCFFFFFSWKTQCLSEHRIKFVSFSFVLGVRNLRTKHMACHVHLFIHSTDRAAWCWGGLPSVSYTKCFMSRDSRKFILEAAWCSG